MERLKALLYCLRCHLVLLIFVGLAAGGYWLRADLYRQFGLAVGVEPKSEPAPSELIASPAEPLPTEPKPAPAEPRSPTPQLQSAQGPADTGAFSFRPLDVPQSEALPDFPNHQELLTQARRAYWNGDIRLAVRGYQRLIDAYPDQPDYPGELGNIYYEQGARQLAASFYLDSARLLLERGERSRAQALAEILDGLDAGAANELRARLAAAGSGGQPGGTPQRALSPTL
jgi:hypothetical protein